MSETRAEYETDELLDWLGERAEVNQAGGYTHDARNFRQVAAELAALRKDRERLEWLEKSGSMVEAFTDGSFHVTPPMDGGIFGRTLREAIDAAMNTKEET